MNMLSFQTETEEGNNQKKKGKAKWENAKKKKE